MEIYRRAEVPVKAEGTSEDSERRSSSGENHRVEDRTDGEDNVDKKKIVKDSSTSSHNFALLLCVSNVDLSASSVYCLRTSRGFSTVSYYFCVCVSEMLGLVNAKSTASFHWIIVGTRYEARTGASNSPWLR